VARALVGRGHEVVALARSDAAARKLEASGAQPSPGNIRRPDERLPAAPPCEAVIHAACEFEGAMQVIERHLLDRLLPYLVALARRCKFYSGGCWLFGATGDLVATEATPFAALPAFAWAPEHMQRILESSAIEPIIIHPAMVYEPDGGVFSSFFRAALGRPPIRLVGAESVRWPLVHSENLASLYVLALEQAAPRESYIGSAIHGLSWGALREHLPEGSAQSTRTLRSSARTRWPSSRATGRAATRSISS